MNCEQNYEEEGLTFAAIFRFIKKSLPFVLVCLLITVMIGVGACAVLSSVRNDEKTVVQAAFDLVYDGAEDGLAPNGAVLDIQKIKSAARVNGAITNLGLDVPGDQVRDAISINGKYSDSVTALIASFEGDEAKALEAVSKNRFYYTRYVVTIDINAVAGLNGDNAALIVNELLNTARENEFVNSYINLFMSSSSYTEEFYSGANMLEVIDLAIVEVEKISSAMQNSRISAEDQTLIAKKVMACNNKIMSLQREIFNSGAFLTESYTIDMVMSSIKGQVSDYNTKIDAVDKQIASIETAIDKMKENAQIIVNDKGEVINGTYFLEVYQTMFNKLLLLSDTKTQYDTIKTNYDKQLVELEALISQGASTPSEETVANARKRLVHVISEVKALAETAEYMLENTGAALPKQAMIIKIAPAPVTFNGYSPSWLKCILISGIVGVLLGFAIAPLLNSFIKKRRKASQIMIVSGETPSTVMVDDSNAVDTSTDEKPQTK